MNKGTIIIALIVAGILGVFLWQGGGSATAVLPVNSQLEKGSRLTAETGMYDFGTIPMNGGVVKTSYVVANNTSEDIKIDSVVTSCMCTTAYVVMGEEKKGPFGMPGHGQSVPRANEVLKVGEKWTIEVIFDPAAHGPAGVGLAERAVYLVDNTGAALELLFVANVTL